MIKKSAKIAQPLLVLSFRKYYNQFITE